MLEQATALVENLGTFQAFLAYLALAFVAFEAFVVYLVLLAIRFQAFDLPFAVVTKLRTASTDDTC